MTQPLRIGFDVPFQPFALMIDGKPGGKPADAEFLRTFKQRAL